MGSFKLRNSKIHYPDYSKAIPKKGGKTQRIKLEQKLRNLEKNLSYEEN